MFLVDICFLRLQPGSPPTTMDPPASSCNSTRYVDRSRLVACRECRRSKIRCSRSFPCEACVRRGCTEICPDGIKETKRSKSDESLMQENARLVGRIKKLERILASLEYPTALLPQSDDSTSEPPSPDQEAHPSTAETHTVSEVSEINDIERLEGTTRTGSFFDKAAVEFCVNPDNPVQTSENVNFDQNNAFKFPYSISPLHQNCQFTDEHNVASKGEMKPDDGSQSQGKRPSGSLASLSSLTLISSIPDGSVCGMSTVDTGQLVWNPSNGFAFSSVIPNRSNLEGLGKPPTTEFPEGVAISSFPRRSDSATEAGCLELCQTLLMDTGVFHGSDIPDLDYLV